MVGAHQIPTLTMILVFVLVGMSPIDSFRFSPATSTATPSSLGARKSYGWGPKYVPPNGVLKLTSLLPLSLKSTQGDDNGESTAGSSLSVDAILGITASLVVLYSEFTLKTTGCGLPAGPFGLVGAIEGVSYLGVVGICANAASKFFSDKRGTESDTSGMQIATVLGLSAAIVGIAVLGFQVVDYGYIPNAVPMEGGMCK